MPSVVAAKARVVPFSEDWVDGFVDLSLENDARDPLYAWRPSREALRARTLARLASPPLRGVHLIYVEDGTVAGSARAFVIPDCGGSEKTATLSLMVRKADRGRGVGATLVARACEALASQGIPWIEIAVMDAWDGWRRFLARQGFAPATRFADARLEPRTPIRAFPPLEGVLIRPVRLPEDRAAVLALYNGERARDLPRECAVAAGQPAWWEVGPDAANFDPAGFLVAVERRTGDLVGYVSSVVPVGDVTCGRIEYLDVAARYLGTDLREALLVRVIGWLRGREVGPVLTRLHPEYRGEGDLFARLGFRTENPATVWRRGTQPVP